MNFITRVIFLLFVFISIRSVSFAQITESFESLSYIIAQDWKYTGFNKSSVVARTGSRSVQAPPNLNIAYIESDTFVVTTSTIPVIHARLQNSPSTSNSSVQITVREVFTNVTSTLTTSVMGTMWVPVSGITINTPGVYVVRYQMDVEFTTNNGFLDDFSVLNASWYNASLGFNQEEGLFSNFMQANSASSVAVYPNVWSKEESPDLQIQLNHTVETNEELKIFLIATTGKKTEVYVPYTILSENKIVISPILPLDFQGGAYYLFIETRNERLSSKLYINP